MPKTAWTGRSFRVQIKVRLKERVKKRRERGTLKHGPRAIIAPANRRIEPAFSGA